MFKTRDDISLLTRAGQGDRQAFGALVEIHHRPVINFVHRFLGIRDSATAEDIAQEAFLAAWKAAPSFTPRASVRTYLFRIAANKCLNHQRAKRRKPTVPLSDDEDPPDSSSSGAPENSMDRAALSAELKRAVAALKPKQRAAIILRHAHDFSHAEIAEILHTNASAVKSLLFRAHTRLRKSINLRKSEFEAKPSRFNGAHSHGKVKRNELPELQETPSFR